MTAPGSLLRMLASLLALVLGVTTIGFLLMVYFGPDPSYLLAGRNATAEQIAAIQSQLGQDQSVLLRYWNFVLDLLRLDWGVSISSGRSVSTLLADTLPTTILLVLPGFILGHVVGVGLALIAVHYRGGRLDRLIMAASVGTMSLSFLVIIILLQVLLCTPMGLDWFPAYGWQVNGFTSYLMHVTVPSLALILISVGYNTRFYRAVLAEQASASHVLVARAYGARPSEYLFSHVLAGAMLPIITRIIFTLPVLVVSGSLLLESYFGIPGIGRLTFEAITNGDQPVLRAVVVLSGLAFGVLVMLADYTYRWFDPRVQAVTE